MARAKSKSKSKSKSSLEERARLAMKQWLNPSNPALEKALYEGITDDDRWLVYADWLQQINDVRGEIIALGLANKTAEATRLAAASEAFLWAGAQDLEYQLSKRTWTPAWSNGEPQPLQVAISTTLGKHGMIDAVSISGLDEEGHVAKAAEALFSAPIGRFVRSLSLKCSHDDRYSGESGLPKLGPVLAAIAKTSPAGLRQLSIGTGGYQLSWTNTGDLGPLLAAAPHLEDLDIEHGTVDLGESIDLPKLRTLRIESGGLDRKNVLAIANATWPSLTKLVIYFGTKDYGANTTRADIAALLAKPSRFPKLTELALCNAEIQGDIVSELAQSPLLGQLESLDLSKGTLIDEDVKVFVDNVALFAMRSLDLSTNYLSPEMESKLGQLFGDNVSTHGQRYDEMMRDRTQYGTEAWVQEQERPFRYTAVGE